MPSPARPVPPLQLIEDPLLQQHQISLAVLRLDQLWPALSGNKYFKLKHNLRRASVEGATAMLSFGGAFSNHIHALAMAGQHYGMPTIGVIRGEASQALNPTLRDAKAAGMQLHFVSRQDYRRRYEPAYWQQLRQRFGNIYIVPEGGNNRLGAEGCREIVDYLPAADRYDLVAVPCGTGNTLAGLAAALPASKQVLGVAVLKGAAYLERDIAAMLAAMGAGSRANWRLELDCHGGGYAKLTPALAAFVDWFSSAHVPIEPVYSGKLLHALWQMIAAGQFAPGTRIVAIHTGGMQGLRGMQSRLQRLLAEA